MTNKEMYEEISRFAAATGREDIVVFCEKKIDQLNKKAEKAKETAKKKRAEGDALMSIVYEAMSDSEYETIGTIAAKIDYPDTTVSKITYRLTQLVKEGKAEKESISVGESSKKLMGYRKIN